MLSDVGAMEIVDDDQVLKSGNCKGHRHEERQGGPLSALEVTQATQLAGGSTGKHAVAGEGKCRNQRQASYLVHIIAFRLASRSCSGQVTNAHFGLRRSQEVNRFIS